MMNPELRPPVEYKDSKYIKSYEELFKEGWYASYQNVNLRSFQYIPSEILAEDPSKAPEQILSNGSTLKSTAFSLQSQYAEFRFATVSRSFSMTKKSAKTAVVSPASFKPFQTEVYLAHMSIATDKSIEKIQLIIQGSILSEIYLPFVEKDHKRQKGSYVDPADHMPLINIGAIAADMQLYMAFIPWEIKVFFTDEAPEKIDGFAMFNSAPIPFTVLSRVITGQHPKDETFDQVRENLLKSKEKESQVMTKTGLMFKGTQHIPIRFHRRDLGDTVEYYYAADRHYQICSGLFMKTEHRPMKIAFYDSELPAIALTEGNFPGYHFIHFGIACNPTQAHANSIMTVNKGDEFKFVFHKDFAPQDEDMEGYIMIGRMMNLNAKGLVQII